MSEHKVMNPIEYPTTLIVGIQTPENFATDTEAYFEEFRNLVESNGIEYHHELYIKLRLIDPAYFITKGKLADLVRLVKENNIEEVIFSEPLERQQVRNLRKMLGTEIFDRTELILDIFEKNAHSAEGKHQVELARLMHRKARVSGRGIHYSQQAGFIGARGPGETQKEKEIQHIESRILKIKRDLDHLNKIRATQRKTRLLSKDARFCIIGYTNAGKSSLLNALTKSSVLAEHRLFATLDTTTRELFINSKKIGIISDTVGFIQNLPHALIEAFKSTLDELSYAHLLIHVVDLSNKNWEQHIQVVKAVLAEMNLKDMPILTVFNKVDLLSDKEIAELSHRLDRSMPYCLCSTLSEHGLDCLTSYLAGWEKPHEHTL